MAERNFTDGDVKALGKEIAAAIGKGNSGGGGGGGGGEKTAVSKEATNTFNSAMKDAADAANKVTGAYNKVAPSIEKSLDTWRDLSKVGAGFSNDIVGMTAAAAGTRMPLGEFAGVIKENAANLSGFGGNVTRGGEEFARLSKRMFDDYAPNTDQLRQMGLANKDLNELLMIQSVSTRAKMKDGDEKDKKLIENAIALGTEMDLMAKLTGKSREAQMEQQRKNQQDMAFEAAIRRKTIGMSGDEALEFEKNARNQLRDAQLRGQEAVFKDVFATGTIKSKEAAAQASINQEQAAATMKQAQVSADKTMDAKERERQATIAAAEGRKAFDKDMQNDTKLMYASLGEQGGTMGKVMRDSMGANIEYQRNLEATATKMGIVMKTDEDRAKVQKQMEEDAKAAASGRKADGTQGDATTKALVNLGARAGDVESAFMNKIVKPLNEQVNPAFNKLAEGVLGATTKGGTETKVKAIERELDEGAAGKTTTGLNKLSGARVETGNIVNQLSGVQTQPKPIPKKALGGPVEEGEPYIVGDGGEEEIFVPKSAGEIIPKSMLSPKGLGSRSENMESAYKSMQSMNPAKMFEELKTKTSGGGLNLNEISKDISTTISGGASSIKLDAAALADITKPFEKSFASFNTGFEDVVAKMATDLEDAMPLNAMDQTADALEFASKRREELEAIMNDGMARSGAEWDEIFDEAEQLDGQIEKLTNKQLDAMSKYADGWSNASDIMDQVYADIDDAMPIDTEFGDLDGAIAKNKADDAMQSMVQGSSPTKIDRGISMDSFTLGPNGLPIAKPKPTAAAIPEKPAEKQASPGKKINPETGEEYTPVGDAKPADKKTVAAGGSDNKSATLDDLLKSMNSLNMLMGQLIATTESGHKDVAKAAKSNNTNLYAR